MRQYKKQWGIKYFKEVQIIQNILLRGFRIFQQNLKLSQKSKYFDMFGPGGKADIIIFYSSTVFISRPSLLFVN